ncbi:I78 family peptidase inhibitor [Sphingomonas abietis]|uniref:I78 family peptidase inhibitor n=1 Tax=Sphingomonas abietis TaxID=3012344 RepID=A0ABY7NRN1_9SPHN|nr:I78 family peptidase inhibitor [Sphingomonas abietis]WBO24158.1 I78 family peptidase inhibitor [Sphingomonas abietis]
MRSEAGLAASAAAAMLLLAGCTPVEMRGGHGGHHGGYVAGDDACQALPAQRYVGAAGDPGAIQGAKRASGARSVRVVRPGEMATMDFRADRMTVTVDKHGVIGRIVCG